MLQVAIDVSTENAELRRTVERINAENQELRQELAKLNTEIDDLKETHTNEISDLKETHTNEINDLKETHTNEICNLKETHTNEIDKLKETHTNELQKLTQLHQARKDRLQARYSAEAERVMQENTDLRNSLTVSKQKLDQLYQTVGRVSKTKHVVQTIKRKNSCITKWKSETSKWRKTAKASEGFKTRVDNKSRKLKSLQKEKSNRNYRAQAKAANQTEAKLDTNLITDTLRDTVATVRRQNEEILFLENNLNKAQETIDGRGTIPTRLGNRIHPSMKEASMLLQGIGVAEKQVGPAIHAVVSTLTEAELDGPLPSNASQQRLSGEMASVAKQHLREKLENEHNLTLKYDGTTKKGRHIVEVELETKDDTLLIGAKETVGGTAVDYIECISSVVNEVHPDMLTKVSNTMTDRVIVNKAIDRGLEEIKGGKLNSFRCSVHPLDTIHKQSDKFVKAHELTLTFEKDGKYPFQKGGESKTQATLRCVDKLFHDSAAGLPKELPHYLKSKGVKGGENSSLYPRWVGNRFNIFFVNAGLLYQYNGLIQEFQTKYIKPRNGLHHAVFNMLSQGKIQHILRALGLVNKFLTGPWMEWQGTRQGILATSQVFTRVLDRLDNVNTMDIVNGFEETAFGKPPKCDDKYVALTTSTSQDKETADVLGGLLSEATDVMRRQLVDHLPGGKFHNPDNEVREAAKSCTSNNISGERAFAKIDSQIMKARSATLEKSISKAQFSLNKVPSFLKSKSKEERAEIMKKATSEARKDRVKEKEYREHLQKSMRERLESSRRELERKEENSRTTKENIINTVLINGLWKTDEEIAEGVKSLSKAQALLALKGQVRFRMDILGCVHPQNKKIAFTKATQQDFETYLKELIQAPIPELKEEIFQIIDDPAAIVGFSFNQKWSEDGVDSMCPGSILKLVNPQKKHEAEYECYFDAEEAPTFQTVSEIITDIVVGDMFIYVK